MVKQRKTCEERELGALRCQPEIRQWRPGCYSHSYWLQAKLWEGERETREWREGGGGADSGERECVDSKSNSYPFHLFIAQYQEVLLVSHGHPAPSVVKPRSKYHCMEGRQKECQGLHQTKAPQKTSGFPVVELVPWKNTLLVLTSILHSLGGCSLNHLGSLTYYS